MFTLPSLISLRHPCGPVSSVNCRMAWGCARPLSDRSVTCLQKNVSALPMNYFWMIFSTRGTPFGRWVTRVNGQFLNHIFLSSICLPKSFIFSNFLCQVAMLSWSWMINFSSLQGSATLFPGAIKLPCTEQLHKPGPWLLMLSTLYTCVLPGNLSWAVPGIACYFPCPPGCCGIYARAKALLNKSFVQPQAEASGTWGVAGVESVEVKKAEPLPGAAAVLGQGGRGFRQCGWLVKMTRLKKMSGASLKACDVVHLLQLEQGMMSRSKTLA